MINIICVGGVITSKSTVLLFYRFLLPILLLLQCYSYYHYYCHFQSSLRLPKQSKLATDKLSNITLTHRDINTTTVVSVSNVSPDPSSTLLQSSKYTGSDKKPNNPIDSNDILNVHMKIQNHGLSSKRRPQHLSRSTSGRKISTQGFNDPFLILADHRSGYDWFAELLRNHKNTIVDRESNGIFCIGSNTILNPSNSQQDIMDGSCKHFEWSFVRDSLNRKFSTIEALEEQCDHSRKVNKFVQDEIISLYVPKLCSLFQNDTSRNDTTEHPKKSVSSYIDNVMSEIWWDKFKTKLLNVSSSFEQCYCPLEEDTERNYRDEKSRQARILRGIPIMSDWVTSNEQHFSNLLFSSDHSRIKKVVRLKRDNMWNRFIETNHDDIFVQANQKAKYSEQIFSKDRVRKFVSPQDLISFIEWLQNYDATIDDDFLHQREKLSSDGKDILEPNDIDILWIEYDSCRRYPSECINGVLNFLIDQGEVTERKPIIENQRILEGEYTPNYLDYISNPNEVIESLCSKGCCSCINQSVAKGIDQVDAGNTIPYQHSDLYHLIYERRPNKPVRTVHVLHDMTTIVINTPENGEQASNEIVSKWDVFIAPLQYLESISPHATVVLSEDQGVSYSSRIHNVSHIIALIVQFRTNYLQLARNSTSPVIVSTSREINEENDAVSISGWANKSSNRVPDGNFISGSARNILRFVQNLREFLHHEEHKHRSDAEALREFINAKPENVILDQEQMIFGTGFVATCPQDSNLQQSQSMLDHSTLFFYNSISNNCVTKPNDDLQEYPNWGESNEKGIVGINLEGFITHLDRKVKNNTFHLGNVDPYFGTELLYVVNLRGVWTSNVERDLFRIQPTDKLIMLAHSNLMRTYEKERSRWPNLVEVITRQNGDGFPYWAWYGDLRQCSENNSIDADGRKQNVPLFTTCAVVGCNYNFPTPAYMTIIDSQRDPVGFQYVFNEADKNYPWQSKERKAVWRGSLSESSPDKVFESIRWRLCKEITSLDIDNPRKKMFDVALTEIPSFLTDQVEVDADIVGGVQPKSGKMDDFQKYLAILDMDGNSWSSRFGTLLCYNSVTIKIEPAYEDHFFRDLIPWRHYVPVKADLSDLFENVQFILDVKNDWIARNIVNAANTWCAERFTQTELANDLLDTWEAYIRLLNQYDVNWHDRWATKRQELFHPNSTNNNLILLK